MSQPELSIPPFREDGYLPEGLYVATDAETFFRFGTSTSKRRKLAIRLRYWVNLARTIGALRFMIDGSFVTAKEQPNDIDAVILIPEDFEFQINRGIPAALEMEEMLLKHQPEELYAAEDQQDWNEWIQFFSKTREQDNRRKGLVEIKL